MKKLILSAAIVLGSLATYAQVVPVENKEVKTVTIQEEYREVKVDKIPNAVKKALETANQGAVIDKGYINDKQEYKLEISVGEQKATVYADAEGNWINK